MPLSDITIDTNILMHANNTNEIKQGDCIALLNYLLASSEMICIDEEVNIDKSRILHEYVDKLRTHGTTGRNFIEKIFKQKRFKPISKRTDHRITKIINQHINRNKQTDKIFIKITYNSIDKTLVSHDFEDFHKNNRKILKRMMNINILEAKDIIRE